MQASDVSLVGHFAMARARQVGVRLGVGPRAPAFALVAELVVGLVRVDDSSSSSHLHGQLSDLAAREGLQTLAKLATKSS